MICECALAFSYMHLRYDINTMHRNMHTELIIFVLSVLKVSFASFGVNLTDFNKGMKQKCPELHHAHHYASESTLCHY